MAERKSTLRTEILGGTTTFITMACIIVVHPAILSFAGIPVGPGTVATILTAIVGDVVPRLFHIWPAALNHRRSADTGAAYLLSTFRVANI
jgi:AGZA family xanthine/uracil permease-like MFS transporter